MKKNNKKIIKNKLSLIFLYYTIFSFACIIFFSLNVDAQWKKTNNGSIKQIINQCLKSKKTKSNEDLIIESQKLIEFAKNQNKNWDDKYFELVSQLQDSSTKMQRFISLTTSANQLKEIIDQLNTNIVSVKEIYKNRLKAIPTAYLLLTAQKANIEKQSRKDIDISLSNLSKEYLGDYFLPTFITSQTTVKNLKVVKDIIKSTESGRVESFESDPVRQMSENGQFYLLQKYRIYPEFDKSKKNKSKLFKSISNKLNTDFKAEIIANPNNRNIPKQFEVGKNFVKLKKMFEEVKKFNSLQTKQLIEINKDYAKVLKNILVKKKNAQKELKAINKSLRKDFYHVNKTNLKNSIASAEEALNDHVKQREMIVVTVQSELSQRGEHLNDLYAKMVKQAYEELLNRAQQLKSYKFFNVENHVLISQEAKSFYSNPNVVEYIVPLRRKTYIQDEGGVYRCGIILGLRINFNSKDSFLHKNDNLKFSKNDKKYLSIQLLLMLLASIVISLIILIFALKFQETSSDPRAYFRKGTMAYKQKDFNNAINYFSRAILFDPNYAYAYYKRGNARKMKEQFSKAISDYTKAIEIEPNYALAYFNRGNSWRKKNNIDNAIKDYSEVLKHNSNFSSAFYNRGLLLKQKGNIKQALIDINQAIKLSPKNKSYLILKADLASLGNYGLEKEAVGKIRDIPLEVPDKEYKTLYNLDKFGHPKNVIKNNFNKNDKFTVIDNTAGLMWQKSGTDTRLDFQKVIDYIKELNKNKYSGYNYENWRLPTIEELISLLHNQKDIKNNNNSICNIDPIFNNKQTACWSSDKLISGFGLILDFVSSSVYKVNLNSSYYVRAVRSITI